MLPYPPLPRLAFTPPPPHPPHPPKKKGGGGDWGKKPGGGGGLGRKGGKKNPREVGPEGPTVLGRGCVCSFLPVCWFRFENLPQVSSACFCGLEQQCFDHVHPPQRTAQTGAISTLFSQLLNARTPPGGAAQVTWEGTQGIQRERERERERERF